MTNRNGSPPELGSRKIDFLPDELLLNIFSYFNIQELFKCAHVNKKFRQIMKKWKCQRISTEDIKLTNDLGSTKIESLPDELLLNIFSYFNIQELFKFGQVNKKLRQISHDKSFWIQVNLCNQRVTCYYPFRPLILPNIFLRSCLKMHFGSHLLTTAQWRSG